MRIELFETDNRRCPVADYLAEVERRRHERARITRVFRALEEVGPCSYLKKLSGYSNVWEIVAGDYRFLGLRDGGALVLTHAFRKKTQKTPREEIEVAVKRESVYFARRREQR